MRKMPKAPRDARLRAWLWFAGIYLASVAALATITALAHFLTDY